MGKTIVIFFLLISLCFGHESKTYNYKYVYYITTNPQGYVVKHEVFKIHKKVKTVKYMKAEGKKYVILPTDQNIGLIKEFGVNNQLLFSDKKNLSINQIREELY